MTDDNDNVTDISGRLPVEVRKPWRKQLPEWYVRRIDQLKEFQAELKRMRGILQTIRGEFRAPPECTHSKYEASIRYESLADYITAASALLEHAETQLFCTCPFEESVPKEYLVERDDWYE
jgi:hypothetical protein